MGSAPVMIAMQIWAIVGMIWYPRAEDPLTYNTYLLGFFVVTAAFWVIMQMKETKK